MITRNAKVFDESSPVQADETRLPIFEEVKEKIHNRLLEITGLKATSLNFLETWREIVIKIKSIQHTDPSLQFATVISGDLALLTQNLNSLRAVKGVETLEQQISFRDAEGLSLVDVAYLSGQTHIGRYLVSRFPTLAAQACICNIGDTVEYARKTALHHRVVSLAQSMGCKNPNDIQFVAQLCESMLYTGQNILHIAIMRQDFEETRWITDFYTDHLSAMQSPLDCLLKAKATGAFFNRPDFYMGRTPLQFSVCSNNIKMFDVVHNCSLNAAIVLHCFEDDTSPYIPGIYSTDERGNNLLHLCVLMSLPSMGQHVLHAAEMATKSDLNESVWSQRGDQFTMPVPATHGFPLVSPVHKKPARNTLSAFLDSEPKRVVDARIVHALNADLHSPITLAAAIINKDADDELTMSLKLKMLSFLIDNLKQTAWKYGPVSLPILHLDGLEVKYNVDQDYLLNQPGVLNRSVHGAITWLCMNDSDQAMLIPEIQKIVQAKWQRIGYPRFILSFVLNTTLTALVTLILIFINITPASNSNYHTVIFVNVLYAVVASSLFVMFLQEVRDLLVFGSGYASIRGIARFEKVLRVVKILAFVSFCCCKAVAAHRGQIDDGAAQQGPVMYYNVRDDQGIKVSMVVCVIASYLHLYYFFMGFDSTGPFVLTMFRIVSKDVPYFMNFYMLVVAAFACALSLLASDRNNHPGYGFFQLLKASWTLIQTTVGTTFTHDNISDVQLYPQHLQWLADILLTFYSISVIIVMLNLLIAMISDTYADLTTYNDAFLLIAKYDIMSAMEWAMWKPELQRLRDQYAQRDETAVASELQQGVHTRYVFELATAMDREWFNGKDVVRAKIEGIEPPLYGKTALLIINPQRDLYEGGALGAGSNQDSARVAEIIKLYGRKNISDIFVTQMSPPPCHISHSASWRYHSDGDGDEAHAPHPFTRISYEDVVNKTWVYQNPTMEAQDWVEWYTRELQRKGTRMLTIWPEHCIVGSLGHCVVPDINAALQRWANTSTRPINYTLTGHNLRVEMYSALRADVVDPFDSSTTLNLELVSNLKLFDRVTFFLILSLHYSIMSYNCYNFCIACLQVLVCGPDLSHSVNYTMRDLIDLWGSNASKLVLLKDGEDL